MALVECGKRTSKEKENKEKKKKVKKKQKKKVTRPKKARLEKGTQKTVGCGRFEGETVNILHSRKGKFRAEAKMEASEAESVARCALQAYQKLPKIRAQPMPGQTCWKTCGRMNDADERVC